MLRLHTCKTGIKQAGVMSIQAIVSIFYNENNETFYDHKPNNNF